MIKHSLGLELVCVGTKCVGVSVKAGNQDHSGLAILDEVFASNTDLALAFRLRHQYKGGRWRLEAQGLPYAGSDVMQLIDMIRCDHGPTHDTVDFLLNFFIRGRVLDKVGKGE